MLNCFAMTGAFTIFNITRDDLAIFIVLIDSLTMSLSSAMLTPAWDKLFLSHADSVFKRFSWRFFRATFLSLLLTVSAPSSFLIKVCGRFKSPPPPPLHFSIDNPIFIWSPGLFFCCCLSWFVLCIFWWLSWFCLMVLLIFCWFFLTFWNCTHLTPPFLFIYLFFGVTVFFNWHTTTVFITWITQQFLNFLFHITIN